MSNNAIVEKTGNENNASLLRRFTKKVQSAGFLQQMRGRRYFSRPPSRTMKRKSALKLIGRRAERMELAKLGKLPADTRKRR